jgi:hypothetical protein
MDKIFLEDKDSIGNKVRILTFNPKLVDNEQLLSLLRALLYR